MLRTFKEFARDKQLNERLFAHVDLGYGSRQPVPVYINPTISDIEAIISTAPRIRGFNKSEHIFIWNEDQASHQQMSNGLGDYDEELKGQPDICFYLSVQKRSPLQLNLSYSSFTGKSIRNSELGSTGHLQQLLKNPVMQKLQPVIENYDEIINWKPQTNSTRWNPVPQDTSNDDDYFGVDSKYGDDIPFLSIHHKTPTQPRLTNLPHFLTAANNPKPIQKQNPYKWRSGLHRVGD